MTAADYSHIDLNRLHDDAAEIARDAIELGWHATQIANGTVHLFSPDKNNKQDIALPPIRQWNQGKLRSIHEKVLRYSETAAVAALKTRRKAEKDAKAAKLAADRAREEERLLARAKAQEVAADQVAEDRIVLNLTDGKPINQRRVVSEHPWVVRQGGERKGGLIFVYDSKSVVQRNWSDDTVDFICGHCREYTNENPASVQSHWSKSIRNLGHPRIGRVIDEEKRLVPIAEYSAHTAKRLRGSGKEQVDDVSEEESTQLPVEPDSAQQLTDAQTLEAIRELVLPGLADQEAELTAKIDAIRTETEIKINEMQDALVKMTASRDRWKAKHATLKAALRDDDEDDD